MPFELFPASRSTEIGKRKLVDDADRDSTAAAAGNQKDSVADGGKEAETTTDEEVEEFFAILKRLHAATKYIEKIDGASGFLMGKRSKKMKASEEEGDEVEITAEKSTEHKLDLDLNLEPASVESDGKESRSGLGALSGRSHDLTLLAVDSAADSRRK